MPARQHHGGGEPGGIEAAAQAQRQEDEREAGEAAQEVRELDQGQRRHWCQPGQALGGTGSSTRDQQHDAGDEDEDEEEVGDDHMRPAAHHPDPLAGDVADLAQLVADEEHGRRHERGDVVAQAVDHEGGRHPWVQARAGERQDQHRLEHADPARHVADDPDHAGSAEQAGEGREADPGLGRQQHPQAQGRQRPVDPGHADLGGSDHGARQGEAPAAERERATEHQWQSGVGQQQDQHEDGEGDDGAGADAHDGGELGRRQ